MYGFLCEHWLKPANFQKNLLISRLLNWWRDKKNTEGTSLFGSTTTNNPSVIIDKKCHHLLTPIYQKSETHCKMNMLKLTYQTYLEAGKSQQLLSPSTSSLPLQMLSTLPLQSYTATASFFYLGSCLTCHCLYLIVNIIRVSHSGGTWGAPPPISQFFSKTPPHQNQCSPWGAHPPPPT